MEVVAEGVETRGQLGFMAAHGCDVIQGWLFSPALPAEEMGRFLEKGGAEAPGRHAGTAHGKAHDTP